MARMLRVQQDQEYEDALMEDQMRQIKKQEEEEKAQRDEFERVSQLAEDAEAREETNGSTAADEKAKAAEEEKQKAAEQEKLKEERKARRKEKAAEINAKPEPPPAGNARIQLRLPNGQRTQRAFLAEDLL